MDCAAAQQSTAASSTMSRLALYGRPWVVFDAKNKLHRQWFADFNLTNSWGRCPVRFVVNEEASDLVTHIQRELIQFYVDKEFGTVQSPKLVTKKQRTVVDKPRV